MRSPSCSGGRGAVMPRPVGRHRLVEARLDPFDRDHFAVETRRLPVDPDQLDQAEPVQPAGQPRDLAVMAERGIDEARGPDEACAWPRL